MTARVFSAVLNGPKDDFTRHRLARSIVNAPLHDEYGRLLRVTCTRVYVHRSLGQNRLYQQWARIIAKATGNTVKAVKRVWQLTFLGFEYDHDIEAGDVTRIDAHTSTLSFEDFGEFLIQIETWSVEFLEIELPAPDDPVAWEIYERFLKAA